MHACIAVVVGVLNALVLSTCDAAQRFPPGFRFGAATAAYQVEGAWNVSDKSPSIWDTFTHQNRQWIVDGSTGDVACDSYHLWERDVELAKEMGLHFYRFSISWSRLLPSGFANKISEDGSRYYNSLIDGLLASGVQPMVTLYHWDLPQKLQDLGGWTNPLTADWFADYSRVAYTLFGDRVKTWTTFNEPIVSCDVAYETGIIAPSVVSKGVGNYICVKNVMLAHAKAYRVYGEEFRSKYNGKIGIVNSLTWYEPNSSEDLELTELARQLAVGLYSHPIYSAAGGWPPSIENYIEEKSKKEGYPRSRLPAFTDEEISFIKGTYDYYGINYYTSRLVRRAAAREAPRFWPAMGSYELGALLAADPSWGPRRDWLVSFPSGLRRQMNWLREQYGDIEIRITENGFITSPELDDGDRIHYIHQHLEQVLLAITEDGLNVTAYTVWSLFDNFEWNNGYTSRFGLANVNFTDPLRTRTPRASAHYYATVIQNHALDSAT